MDRKLDDIFNECYERILQGERFDICLKRYPEYAAELEPLLRTALGLTWRASSLKPRPEFKYWTRVRLQGTQTHARQQRPPEKPGFLSWQRAWAVAITVILVFLLAGSGTAAASTNALPDESLYPVKLGTEQLRITFAFSDEQKAKVYTELSETRAVEIETMAVEGKIEEAAATAERLVYQMEQADSAISRVASTEATLSTATTETTVTEPAPPEERPTPPAPEEPQTPPTATTRDKSVVSKTELFRESLDASTSKSLTALQNALEKAPPQSKPALQHAIDRISERGHGKPPQESGDKDRGHEEGPQPPSRHEGSQPPAKDKHEETQTTGENEGVQPSDEEQYEETQTTDENEGIQPSDEEQDEETETHGWHDWNPPSDEETHHGFFSKWWRHWWKHH